MDKKNLVICLIGGLLVFTGSQQPANAQTTSPFKPPDEKLGVYVVNQGGGLDTGCTFRSGGPLIIQLPVPVVVNPNQLNGDGTLINATHLIKNKVLGAQAVLRFPLYDIDSGANISPPYQPEMDDVSFNGQHKKVLSGINNQWTDDSIAVPIEEVKFGKNNEIRIDIDTANSQELWCMAVDWVAIEFDVAAPYVLAHGINAQADTWDAGSAPGVLQALDDKGVLYTRFSVTANGRSAGNARQLETQIQTFLDNIKAKKVNIIAHSKGGLDSQELQARAPKFKILSLSTISTPHIGSVAADLSLIQKTSADEKVNNGNDPTGFASAYIDTWTFGNGPQLPGLRDLTVARAAAARNLKLRGNISPTFTIGANADLNSDNALTSNESAGLFPKAAHYAAERSWRVLRNFSSANMTTAKVPGNFFGTRTVLTYTAVTQTAQDNDIVVTTASANPTYGTALGNTQHNHSTVKNAANINKILQRTVSLR